MATYTFVCLGHDGTVATVESVECPDDQAAFAAGSRLFDDHPLIRGWLNCRQIEVYDGAEMIGHVQRQPAAAKTESESAQA
jgi:hypothetical protein